MAKTSSQRTADPVIAQVPWGQQATQMSEEPAASQPEFVESMVPQEAPQFERIPTDPSPFVAEPTPQRKFNPFTDKPPVEKVNEPEPFSMDGAPSWGDFVKFIMKHGNVISEARYPQPRGEVVDTLWKGVRVLTHEKCQIRHLKYGWVDWADAIAV